MQVSGRHRKAVKNCMKTETEKLTASMTLKNYEGLMKCCVKCSLASESVPLCLLILKPARGPNS